MFLLQRKHPLNGTNTPDLSSQLCHIFTCFCSTHDENMQTQRTWGDSQSQPAHKNTSPWTATTKILMISTAPAPLRTPWTGVNSGQTIMFVNSKKIINWLRKSNFVVFRAAVPLSAWMETDCRQGRCVHKKTPKFYIYAHGHMTQVWWTSAYCAPCPIFDWIHFH